MTGILNDFARTAGEHRAGPAAGNLGVATSQEVVYFVRCAVARDIGRDVGAHWHLVYRVLRGLRGGGDPVGQAVLAHPLAGPA